MYICMYVCMYVCTCMYICMCVCMCTYYMYVLTQVFTLIGKDHIIHAFNKHGLLNEVWIVLLNIMHLLSVCFLIGTL